MKFETLEESLAYCQNLVDEYTFCLKTKDYQKGIIACEALINYYQDQTYYKLANEVRFDQVMMLNYCGKIDLIKCVLLTIKNNIKLYDSYILNQEDDIKIKENSILSVNKEKYPHYMKLIFWFKSLNDEANILECLLLVLEVATDEDKFDIIKAIKKLLWQKERDINKYLKLKVKEEIITKATEEVKKESILLYHDPIEQTPSYLKISDELEEKIIKEIGPNDGMGYCFTYWQTKKRILKEDYGITWHSPRELNPKVRFD